MLCDSPTNYEKEPDYTRFVAEIPTVWEETRVLQGEVGEYIVTARRKGECWYIGGITNWNERDIELDLAGLCKAAADGKMPVYGSDVMDSVTIYTDGKNAHRNGSDYREETFLPTDTKYTIHLAPGGGFLMKIKPFNH